MVKTVAVVCGSAGLALLCGCAIQRDHVEVASAPSVLYAPGPEYPETARVSGVSGQVFLRVTVDTLGQTASASVTAETPAGYGFAEAALEAVRNWVWEPGTLHGVPINQGRQIEMRFSAHGREGNWTPRIVHRTSPRAPEAFAASKERAEVLVRAEVNSEGKPLSVSVARELPGPRGLAEAALDCVRGWRFSPGLPGTVIVLVPFGPKQAEDGAP